MDLSDPVLEGRSLDVIFHVAILKSPFEGYELALFEGNGRSHTIRMGIERVIAGAIYMPAAPVLLMSPYFPPLVCSIEHNQLVGVVTIPSVGK
jgi:hypothetical protein